MPDTRGRTSDTRVGAMRPGSSRTMARACGLTVTMLTSGSVACAAATATFGSSQPANNGAKAASIKAMPADCARNPDIDKGHPKIRVETRMQIRVRRRDDEALFDGVRIRGAYCDATRFVAAQCHT